MPSRAPTVSVVTVCFNTASHIADALRSLDKQSWADRRHPLLNRASRDATLEVGNGHPRSWRRVISEPDSGIYDARNRGIHLATVHLTGFYASTDALAKVAKGFEDPSFVTRKIALAASCIARVSPKRLALVRLDIVRDWAWALEYAEAMWRMLKRRTPRGYVGATGNANLSEAFVATTFEWIGVDCKDNVDVSRDLFRLTDLAWGQGRPELAAFGVRDWRCGA